MLRPTSTKPPATGRQERHQSSRGRPKSHTDRREYERLQGRFYYHETRPRYLHSDRNVATQRAPRRAQGQGHPLPSITPANARRHAQYAKETATTCKVFDECPLTITVRPSKHRDYQSIANYRLLWCRRHPYHFLPTSCVRQFKELSRWLQYECHRPKRATNFHRQFTSTALILSQYRRYPSRADRNAEKTNWSSIPGHPTRYQG